MVGFDETKHRRVVGRTVNAYELSKLSGVNSTFSFDFLVHIR